MTYIKINKASLDYHYYSDFHVFTMNNFVRNVMQKGKYKKAVKIVRLGLLNGLKELHLRITDYDGQKVARTYKTLNRSQIAPKRKAKMDIIYRDKNNEIESKEVIKENLYGTQGVPSDDRLDYYQNLTTQLTVNNGTVPACSFFDMFVLKHDKYTKRIARNILNSDPTRKFIYEQDGYYITTNELPPKEKMDFQYSVLEDLEFKKLYSIKPHIKFYGVRNLSVFDMVIQVYSMLSGVWYMRKSKVSGRTILIPSPLRPYRRITTATKMLLKGIRKRRREDRYYKNAMIRAIGAEFFWLVFYNGIQYTKYANQIDNSHVWLAKNESHKELVANLKNIKHLKYF